MLDQLLLNGIVVGCTCALLGVGLNLFILGSGFFNLSYGSVYVVAAYAFVAVHQSMHLGAMPGVFVAAGSAIGVALAQEKIIFEPLRRSSASPGILLLVSLVLLIIVQNAISLVFGDLGRSVRGPELEEALTLFTLRVTSLQVATVVATGIVASLAWAFFQHSSVGKQIRALASDSELAEVVGIRRSRARVVSTTLGAMAAAVAAVLATYENGAEPVIGFNAALLGVVTLIVGGVRSVGGAVLAGLLIGVVRQLALGSLSGQWQDAAVFVILFVFLLVRPQGFFGKPIRKATA